jgi:hypothetical protein
MKAILIRRLYPDDVEMIEKLKKATGKKFASKALMEAGRLFLRTIPLWKKDQERIKELEEENKQLRELGEMLLNGCAGLQQLLSVNNKAEK